MEDVIKETHDQAGKYTQPVLRRYPLSFSFLVIFSIAAIMHGFEMWADQINLFEAHPVYLMGIGAFTLILTGTLYKALEKMK